MNCSVVHRRIHVRAASGFLLGLMWGQVLMFPHGRARQAFFTFLPLASILFHFFNIRAVLIRIAAFYS